MDGGVGADAGKRGRSVCRRLEGGRPGLILIWRLCIATSRVWGTDSRGPRHASPGTSTRIL